MLVEEDSGTSGSGLHLGWRHFRCLCVLCNFLCTGSGNNVFQDGDRKRKIRHLPPPPYGQKMRPILLSLLGWLQRHQAIMLALSHPDFHALLLPSLPSLTLSPVDGWAGLSKALISLDLFCPSDLNSTHRDYTSAPSSRAKLPIL